MKALSFVATGALLLAALCSCAGAQNNAVPFLNQSLYPASIAPGSKTFTLTVTGSGFASTAVVNWNGTPQLTEVISGDELKARISAADVATPRTAWVTVTNPAPGGGTSNVVFFPVTEPTSTIGMAVTQAFPNAIAVAVGDFNNDGKLDVAWVTNEGVLEVSLGNGKGGFQAPIQNGTVDSEGGVILNMVAADFNNDGNLDLALATVGGFTVLLGNGQGTFTTSDVVDAFFGGTSGMAVADFNRDGCLDIYVGGWQSDEAYFQIYTGNCKGTFSYFQEYATGVLASGDSSGITSGNPAIGDFNGDGYFDLAVGGTPNEDSNDGEIEIFLGGPEYFTQSTTISTYSVNVATADVNKDGKLDLVTDYGCVLLGNGDGTFGSCNQVAGGAGETVGIADFNGDGNLDIAAGSLVIDLGEGNGKFPEDFAFGLGAGHPGAGSPGGIGDFNDDGKLDAVTPGGYLYIQTTVDLTPITLNFGNQNVGTQSAPQTATLSNIGTSALAITGIGIVGTGSKNFTETNNCGSSLAAGTTCTISVTFTPKSGGTFTPSLGVAYEGTASPQIIALSGTGLTPPTVTLLPATLTYATQLLGTSSPAQTVTLTNTGDQTVNISNISASGAFTQTNSCSSLPPGFPCSIEVVFTPTSAGNASGTLSVADNATNSPQQVALSGVGTAMTVSPTSVNFGDQTVGTSSAAAPVTVSNIGATAVTINSVTLTGADPGDFSLGGNCTSTLGSKSSCTVKVKFTPTATGARSAQVTITDTGGGGPQTVALSGTGT